MPSTSRKQARFMAAIANNPDFAQKVKVPQKVGRDYHRKDKQQGIIGRRRNGG